MRWLSLIVPLIFVAAANADDAAKPVTIPLKDIWALDMPGTKDIRKLKSDTLLQRIGESLALKRLRNGQIADPKPAFAVLGTGQNALQEADAVLVEKKKPLQPFPAESEVSIIFFSYQFGAYVHLDRVERHGNFIEIRYRFVPHQTKEVTVQIAIIPLGKLESDDYNVDIVQSPNDEKSQSSAGKVDKESGEKIVCTPFSFLVK